MIPSYVKLNKFIKSKSTSTTNNFKFDIDISINGKDIIKNSKLNIQRNKKYGVIGKNGIGKTVLLNFILNSSDNIFLVEQEIKKSDMTILETIINSNKELKWLKEQEEIFIDEMCNQIDNERDYDLDDIVERLDQINSDKLELKAKFILNGLGFNQSQYEESVNNLSGGWKMKLSIACGLFNDPDIFLLDEPSNHLDLFSIIWLEDYLANTFNKTLIVTSHDREFLNNVVDNIIFIENNKITQYNGNYDSFYKQRKLIKSESELKLAKMIFPSKQFDDKVIVQIKDVTFGYDKIILKGIDVGIHSSSRIGLIGKNGIGKTTLFNLITEKIKPLSGEIIVDRKINIATFDQHQSDQLDLEITPIEFIRKTHNVSYQSAYDHLAKFNITGDIPKKLIGELSGGYKSRLTFANIAIVAPHLLLLDEPSNHLDIETIDMLVKSLKKFNGAIVMITHNTYLLSQLCDEIWLMKDHSILRYNSNFDEIKDKFKY